MGLRNDFRSATSTFEYLENCEASSIEGTIVNLHPDYPLPDHQFHSDDVFPWLQETLKVLSADHDRIESAGLQEEAQRARLSFQEQDEVNLPTSEWQALKRAWSLWNGGRSDLAESILAKDSTAFGYAEPPESVYDWLCRFAIKRLAPGHLELYKQPAEAMQQAFLEHAAEATRFRDYYIASLMKEQLARYFDAFDDYFKGYGDFSQVLIHQRRRLPIPENMVASSMNFQVTRMVYGNLFEHLTENLTVAVCLNNVLMGRKFDDLADRPLAKYLKSRKAERARALREEPRFWLLCECLDSTLRNGSHHRSMSIDRRTQIITYRSGGTGAKRQITYLEYLQRCNAVCLSLCGLLILELMLSYEPMPPGSESEGG